MKFHNTTLDNGLQIVAELNPNVFSVAMAFHVKTGARDESQELSGVSHFLEHMAFKGNEKFTAEDVNRIFDEIGADPNASTSDEITTFHAVCLTEVVPTAFEVLAGIIFPSLRQDDFDMEKNVILEEIGMYQDIPYWVAYERAMETHFNGHPLGNRILGTDESITALTSEQMCDYHRDHYQAGNITLTVAGNVEWEEIVALAKKHCGHWPAGNFTRELNEPRPEETTEWLQRDGVQEHVYQITTAPSALSSQRYAADLLMMIVGDDSGSRMFWELIDTGLAESASIDFAEYEGYGAYMTYLCCLPEATAENLERIRRIYEDINQNGVTEEELQQAKNKACSRIVLRSERPMGRLRELAGNWVYRQEYRSVEEELQTINAITRDDIAALVNLYPLKQTTTTGIGPFESPEG